MNGIKREMMSRLTVTSWSSVQCPSMWLLNEQQLPSCHYTPQAGWKQNTLEGLVKHNLKKLSVTAISWVREMKYRISWPAGSFISRQESWSDVKILSFKIRQWHWVQYKVALDTRLLTVYRVKVSAFLFNVVILICTWF